MCYNFIFSFACYNFITLYSLQSAFFLTLTHQGKWDEHYCLQFSDTETDSEKQSRLSAVRQPSIVGARTWTWVSWVQVQCSWPKQQQWQRWTQNLIIMRANTHRALPRVRDFSMFSVPIISWKSHDSVRWAPLLPSSIHRRGKQVTETLKIMCSGSHPKQQTPEFASRVHSARLHHTAT